jgi:hypothetical protein
MVTQEPNDSTQNRSVKGRMLGAGYLRSPLQQRDWRLLILVVIFFGGAVVGNKVEPLGAILSFVLLLWGVYAL